MPQFIHQLHSLFLSFYFLLVLEAPPPKLVIPELAQMYSGPRGFSWNFSSRKRAQLAKRWQLPIGASQLAVSLAKKNFKKILWDQGSTNEPARRLGGLRRLRDFLYSYFSTCKIHMPTIICCFPGPIWDHVMVLRELFLSNVLLLNCGRGIGTMRDISVETLP